MDTSPATSSRDVIEAGKRTQDVVQTDSSPGHSALKSYLTILSYGSRNGGIVAMVLGLLCAIGSGVALPLMNIVFGNLAGEFNRYFMPGAEVSEQAFKASVNRNSLYIVYLFIGKFALTYISMICFRIISLRASAALRLEYVQALFAQPVSKLDETSVGTVANAITSLSNTIQQSISDRLAILFQSLALLVAAYAIAFRYSWALTLAVSSAILFVLLAYSITVPMLVKAQQLVDRADEKHAAIAAEAFGSIRTVLSLGAEAPLLNKYVAWIDEARKRSSRLCPVTGIHLAILFFAMYSSYALAFWFGLKLYREGHIGNVNTVIIVFFSVLLVVTVLGAIASPLMSIAKATSASGPFFDMIQSKRISTQGLRSPTVSSQSDIVFDSVTFAYPARPQTTVLKEFSARFRSGKTTAMVGPSGSGKSTIIALIERWYELEDSAACHDKGATQGRILIDGRNINTLDLKWWRTQIGLVEQEPVLFNDSVYNNVAAGLIGTQWEHESEAMKLDLVVTACREAFATEFIDRLPLGYSTIVGEGGINLSGGQRQRLAIARSVIRQPTILILDEATSSIDVRGEQIVQAALDRVSRDRTTIMIAHRLSTLRQADHIVVVKDGANIEEGSPRDLMDQGEFYHGLVHAQYLQTLSDPELPAKLEEESPHFSQMEPVESSTSETGTGEEAADHASIEGSKRGSFSAIWRLLHEQRAHSPLYMLTIVGAMGAGSAFALQSWLFAKLVQVFQFTGQQLVDAANFWSLMFFILALAMAVFYFDLGFISTLISTNLAATYRKDYFQSIMQKPISYYDRMENASGTLMSRLSTDPKQLQELFGINGVFPMISIFSLIGCIIISFCFGWKLAAVTFFAALPFILLAAYLRIRYEIQFEGMNAAVYADSSRFATEAIHAFRTVSALTMEDSIVQRYSDLLYQQQRKAMRKAWYATLIFAFSDSIDLCAMALTFWYGGQLLASREYGSVAFFVVYIAIVQGGQSAGQFFSFGPNIAQAIASIRRILDTRSSPTGVIQELSPSALSPLVYSRADVHFRNVTFAYPSRNTPVFQHLNVSIQSGQFVAFVGPSGCGKSTLISLLERFYEPTQGSVIVGGQDIRTLNRASYRRTLSLVAQEPKLFEGSIKENLLLGLAADDPVPDEEQMVQACKQAEIHEFITSLPDGYSTELGINAQASLSGGQKQRLCIARALIRNPRLLLLDEATSSLDSTSERLIQDVMERLAGRNTMTIIAVAHRLATVQKADVIFVFAEGQAGHSSRIVEQGTHHELLQKREVYWQMCHAQALDQ